MAPSAIDLYKRILGKQLTVHECPACGCLMLGIYVESPTDGHILTQCLGCKKVGYKVFHYNEDWKPSTAPQDAPPTTPDVRDGRMLHAGVGGTAARPMDYTLA